MASIEEEAAGAADPIGEVSERAGRLVIKTLAEAGWKNLIRAAISIREGVRSSVTLLRRLGKVEAFHGFADWLMFGGDLIGHNDPDHHEKIVKFNELTANCVIHQNALDITDVVNQLVAEGQVVEPDDLATISPYIRENVRRFGEWGLDTTPPEQTVTRLDVTLPTSVDIRR
ncbi:hypothetical protein ThrDRAFT_04355 [Frankia casuarinae]|uniref:Tn3 transposase DDE domain-containing protein n=1 Tax=Frankia casuarinae (strain DSM 45818 / CECT 9043 / HFP020203 / CcI3) TaxID=106370 RepID=Q2JAK9_FRACC|nr:MULTISPECIES: Tn3 family transposase [Frankia]ABD11683.1 hypothetical protein Francci3_2315 [Frankia casuarinae]ETA00329.1 hypothetical protein CcI6DRAFT_04271 [Frankia sp. CcI6]EYT90036.1 hypothetical protein ThrDRAFT_04355 [Frankia casuarinae]KDA40526.1 hypothetical protein BMG523Draft_04665 [Frankia sp. BMG5.23]KEZ35572.1 Tn3 transposase DDE domain [Frankia sp. CeD]